MSWAGFYVRRNFDVVMGGTTAARTFGGPGSLIWLPWLFTRNNVLTSADDHSTWTGATGFTASQTDRFGGTTAEKWLEHTGSAAGRSVESVSIATGTGRFMCQIFFKQVTGSASRSLGLVVYQAGGSGTNGAWLYPDGNGNIVSSGGYGSWTFHSGTCVPYGSGWYCASFEYTTTDANVQAFIRQRDGSGNSPYTGDGTSGWFIDDHSITKV